MKRMLANLVKILVLSARVQQEIATNALMGITCKTTLARNAWLDVYSAKMISFANNVMLLLILFSKMQHASVKSVPFYMSKCVSLALRGAYNAIVLTTAINVINKMALNFMMESALALKGIMTILVFANLVVEDVLLVKTNSTVTLVINLLTIS